MSLVLDKKGKMIRWILSDLSEEHQRPHWQVLSTKICLVEVIGVIKTKYVFLELRKSLVTNHQPFQAKCLFHT
ncbi:hypothetical protein Y032_0242g3447 [Ancylostoma ceylanicum]|uniref:Uncharacterized protein n=1 Tax=Ancylostoma ceylanicum TaxID=53326 RepID=A0A016SEN8_9BILA|nr:hypothetical protein Y032_0242g3447 [Ancylostoma ceylanicum]